MAKCGFEQDLGNGLKAGLIGLGLGGLGWLVYGAAKGKSDKPYRHKKEETTTPKKKEK